MKYNLIPLFALAAPLVSFAQQTKDSTITMQPIELKVHFAKQSLLSVSSSVHTLTEATIEQQQPTTLMTSMNTVAGIRMEERSPGSYRIAMRGSLIRSPFGIRNTKIYIDEFPLTDAGGNTYINLLDPSFIHQINIIKGPDGSLYGANSGGIIKIDPKGYNALQNKTELSLLGGSFGLFQQQFGIQRVISPKYQFAFNQAFVTSDGYRDNSALNKKAFQTAHQWNYNSSSQLRLFALYADLSYQTPGGLTQAQYDENPRQARPAAGPNPSAAEQKAAIYNKTLFLGLAHSKQITQSLSHNISIYNSRTEIKNPFITNYETRKEDNAGFRTYFSWLDKWNNRNIQMQLGAEGSLGGNLISNFNNNKGTATNLQAKDKLDNANISAFYRLQLEILKNWNLEASLGLNSSKIKFEKQYPIAKDGTIKFKTEWMPRVATNYTLDNMSWRLSYAKGYSTPTLSEVRSSDNIINPDLQAEKGNNYEIGYKIMSNNGRLFVDFAAYTYTMKNGILRNYSVAGVESYSNIGEMHQKGLEGTLWFHIPVHTAVIKHIKFQTAVAYNHYRFGHYQTPGKDLDGNKLTAVPDWVVNNSLFIDLPYELQLNVYHNYTSSLPLNDANTVFAKKYNLIQSKLIWNTHITSKLRLQVFAGVDNLLNQKYSLGNDINAFGGRYFNAAPTRNYYAGIKLSI